jgi:hypothetical protein
MSSLDVITAVAPVRAALEQLGVRYYVGGSLASSLYGLSRSTMDADLVAELAAEHVHPLTETLVATYYVSEPAMAEAIARQSCFNVIHLATSFKVDVFVLKDREYDREAMTRRRADSLDPDHPERRLYFASPEDVVLAKLEWFRLGGGVSDRQWRDVVEVLRVQAGALDEDYLDRWAPAIGVAELLQKARQDAQA